MNGLSFPNSTVYPALCLVLSACVTGSNRPPLVAVDPEAPQKKELESSNRSLGLALQALRTEHEHLRGLLAQCGKDRAQLSALLESVVAKLPEPSPLPTEKKRGPVVRSTTKIEGTESLGKRLRNLAERVEELARQKTGATERARIESAQQVLIEANRSATHGLNFNAERLAAQVESLLDPSARTTRRSADFTLQADAKRLLGERVRTIESGVLIQLGNSQEKLSMEFSVKIDRLLGTYSGNPVVLLTEDDESQVLKELSQLVRNRIESSKSEPIPELNKRPGLWLWVGYQG